MKANSFLLVLFLSVFTFLSCEKDDSVYSGNPLVDDAFRLKYPDVTHVDWERNGNYSVVDFRQDNRDAEAWFDQNGVWYMTETDLRFDELPEAIKNAFSNSEYQAWRIDDIDKIERKDMETVYVLEAENGNQECDLFYSPDGTLIKVFNDIRDNDDTEHYLPSSLPDAIKDFISNHYPQARILETENERGMTEVDILDGTIHRELLFNANEEWVYTQTQIRKNSVPQLIIDALHASAYSSYSIDEIYYYETPLRHYYYFELESRSKEVELIITNEGNIEVVKISND